MLVLVDAGHYTLVPRSMRLSLWPKDRMRHQHMINITSLVDGTEPTREQLLRSSRVALTIHPNLLDSDPSSDIANPMGLALSPDLASTVLCRDDTGSPYLLICDKRHRHQPRIVKKLPADAIAITFAWPQPNNNTNNNSLLCLTPNELLGAKPGNWETNKITDLGEYQRSGCPPTILGYCWTCWSTLRSHSRNC